MENRNKRKKTFSWKTVSKEYVYSDERLRVRRDQVIRTNGDQASYTVVEKSDFVLIVPKIDGKFYLIEQDRYPISERLIEFPAGGIDLGSGETPEQAARRELLEEIGMHPEHLTKIGFNWLAAGHHTQGCHIFLAEGGTIAENEREDSEYDLETVALTAEQITSGIADGSITDSPSIAAFTLFNTTKQRET